MMRSDFCVSSELSKLWRIQLLCTYLWFIVVKSEQRRFRSAADYLRWRSRAAVCKEVKS